MAARPETGCFVTATDTGAGKTVASLGLMAALSGAGRRVAGMKPVAAGSAVTTEGPRNDDAVLLWTQGPAGLPYADINPYALCLPVAPHVAAAHDGVRIDLAVIAAAFSRIAAQAEIVIVEGAGGWRVPLTGTETTADLVRRLALPVVVVVGLRLGCINHALLTAESIRRDGLSLMGWIANHIDPDYQDVAATIAYLDAHIGAPRIASIPRLAHPSPRFVAATFDAGFLARF
jgi:dethiobiotin synthetase